MAPEGQGRAKHAARLGQREDPFSSRKQGPHGDGFTLPLAAAAEGSTCLALAQLASLQASHWRE
jgi:hypothetical protein